MRKTLTYLIVVFMLNSCVNTAQEESETKMCNLHQIPMKLTRVRVHYGATCLGRRNSAAYPNAKTIQYRGCIVDSIRHTHTIVWTCKECTKLKRKG